MSTSVNVEEFIPELEIVPSVKVTVVTTASFTLILSNVPSVNVELLSDILVPVVPSMVPPVITVEDIVPFK